MILFKIEIKIQQNLTENPFHFEHSCAEKRAIQTEGKELRRCF